MMLVSAISVISVSCRKIIWRLFDCRMTGYRYDDDAMKEAYQHNFGFLATISDIKAAKYAVNVQESKFYPRLISRLVMIGHGIWMVSTGSGMKALLNLH